MSAAYRKACEEAAAIGFRLLGKDRAAALGYSADKRRRRREHRRNARDLLEGGVLFYAKAPVGSTPHTIAMWHLYQARYWGR